MATLAISGLAVAAGSASAANFTWSGGEAAGKPGWSLAGNWLGGSAPGGEVGTLTLPKLGASCEVEPPTSTCYSSSNDHLGGVSVEHISIDDLSPYAITGNELKLGVGGITASSTGKEFPRHGGAYFYGPIALTAPQTWSIDGEHANGQIGFNGTINGGSNTLGIAFQHDAGIDLPGSIEAGTITLTGEAEGGFVPGGTVALFGSGSLNGANGNPVKASNVQIVFGASGSSAVGPLTFSGGGLDTFVTGSGTLTVKGGVSFDSASSFSPSINKAGAVPGTDYTQVTASGPVNLGGARLTILGATFPEGGGSIQCASLKRGDVDTLLTTTGALEGTFAGVPDGTIVTLSCGGGAGTAATAKVNYTEHAVTATIESGGGPGEATTTTLGASPEGPATNQAVTLTATVSSKSGTTPKGVVSFENHGAPIPGCEHQPLSASAPYTATCQASFAAQTSPESLTAGFQPEAGSKLAGSNSTPDDLVVSRDTTGTTLGASDATPIAGASVTYTATVKPSHPGHSEASGSVEFIDNGAPIGSCASQPLAAEGASSTASCTVSYPAAGSHHIAAVYSGDLNFLGSTSGEQEVSVQPAASGAGSSGGGGGAGAGGGAGSGGVAGSKSSLRPPVTGVRETAGVVSGTVIVREPGATGFTALTGTTSVPDGSEIDVTNGRVTITEATATGTATAEVYGGRFRIHQSANGETRFILTLPLTGCPRAALPRGAAALARRHRSGPRSRHLWVSETGGSWGTNGRYVSAGVEGTTWLTLDECTRSVVKVTAGKVKVLDLVRRKTKTLSAGGSYIASAKSTRHR